MCYNICYMHSHLKLTLNVLCHTIPHKQCAQLTELRFDPFWRKWKCAFHPLFAITKAFLVFTSGIFETDFSHFFRGVGLGVYTVHHCHQKVKS